jgi:hypothetical protein
MKSVDELTINEAIEIYYEKHAAIRNGDMMKLLELKNEYPQLFNKEKDIEIRDLIEYAKKFQKSDRYKELSRQILREKFYIVEKDET